MIRTDQQTHVEMESLERLMPEVYQELLKVKKKVETHYRDVCDIDFIIQEGQLFIVNVRPAKRTPLANLRFLIQLYSEKKIGLKEILTRVELFDIEDIIKPEILNKTSLLPLGNGLPAGPGAASGEIALDSSTVIQLTKQGHRVIFVKNEVNPEDVEAIKQSQGILTGRGGMTSHAALVCRGWNKPCIVGFSKMNIRDFKKQIIINGCKKFREMDWITIDGFTGEVFEGRGDVNVRNWRDQPELVALLGFIELALVTGEIPIEKMGQIWRIRDFFIHGIPLRHPVTSKKAVPCRFSVSYTQPNIKTLQKAISKLMPIRPDDQNNYSQMLLSLSDSLSRVLSSKLGIGQHHLYFRPLWNPRKCVLRRNNVKETQFIGFEYFNINRYVSNLLDIATITFLLEVELFGKYDEWFLDFTNPNGESIVSSSDRVKTFRLLINDAEVSYNDLPLVFYSLRRREYYWNFYEINCTCHQEIIDCLSSWPNCNSTKSNLYPLCCQLGLLCNGILTASGESLLGKSKRRQIYENLES